MQGNLILAVDLVPSKGNPNPSPRGEIKGFSKASRKRMIRECARLGSAIPIFVTLTYPKDYPSDPSQWKRDLDSWWKRAKRKDASLSAIWRLEPQERNAPHYHLLIYRKDGKRPFLPHQWVSASWAAVTNGNSDSCSRVEALKSHRGGMFYAAKYCAKLGDGSVPGGWEKVGKHWGKLNVSMLPFPPQHEMILHSQLEQSACLFAMSDAYKASLINSLTAQYEDDPKTQGHGVYLAEKDWEIMKKENEFLGNTGTFFGTAEDFISRMSLKMRELDFRIAEKTGKPLCAVRRDIDKRLAIA